MATKWTTVTFGEVVSLAQGLCFNAKTNHLMAESGIPLLRIADLINNTQTKFVDAERVPKKFVASPEDIIYTRTGQVGLVFRGKIGVVHNNCFRVIPKGGIERDYLYWYLRLPSVIEKARALAGGAAQPDLGHDAFKSIPFSYPETDIQRRIAGILSAYDDLIENNQRRIKILEEMARSLYREWFVHFRFPGHEKVKMVPSPLGPIPQDWEVKKLSEIAEGMRRNVQKGQLDEPQPYVGLEHIPRRSLALDAWETTIDLGSNKLEFKKGEVLFGKIRPYFHKVSVAPFDGLCSADTIVIHARRPEHYVCVVACVSSDAFVAYASATANGAKMPRANWDVLEKYEVVIPYGQVVERFSSAFADIIAQQQALIFQIKNLRRTRDLLLPRLLSGQIPLSC